MSDSFASAVVQELNAFFDPFVKTEGDPSAILAMLARAGWPLDRLAGVDQQRFVDSVASIVASVTELATVAANPPDQTEALLRELASKLGPIFVDIIGLANNLPTGLPPDVSELPVDVLAYLTTSYLERRSLPTFNALRVLGIVTEPNPEAVESGGFIYRVRGATPKLEPKQIVELVTKPGQTFLETYWPHGFDDGGDGAATLASKVWDLALSLGLEPSFARLGESEDLPFDVRIESTHLTFRYATAVTDEGPFLEAGVHLDLREDEQGGPAVSMEPFGSASFSTEFGAWTATLTGTLEANPIEVSAASVRQIEGANPPFFAKLRLATGNADAPALAFGGKSGARVTIDQVGVSFGIALSPAGPEVRLGLELTPLAFSFGTGGADGFLTSALPSDGAGGKAELAIEWSNKTGVRFQGAPALTIDLAGEIPLGPVTIQSLTISGKPHDAQVEVELAATIKAAIGPASGVIERVGVRLGLSFPEHGGNLGPLDVALAFKPPTGVGLAIDTSIVRGGGFLSIEVDAGQYSGVFELTLLGTVSIKAVAIISTKLPDGQSGFALLILITAEGFTPIQLGMGFSLTGIGGLLALHRSIDVDSVRGGLRDGVLDSILFVKDPIENAPRIISTLNRVFPLAQGRFAIGPLAEISWGAPPLVKIRLALLAEVPQPIRIVLLTQLRLVLPDEKTAVVELHVDAVGVLDFGKRELALDASIHDSRLLKFALSGDLALRLNWGDTPTFLLSVGGFHPKFPQPTGLRRLDRLTLALSDSENPKIVFEAYLALTSNSIQMGARVSVYATAAGFGVDGGGSFDALIQWSPFALAIGFEAWVRIFAPTGTLLGARLALEVTGPQPWHITGVAEFTVLFVTARVGVDFRIGEALPPPAAESIDVASAIWFEIGKAGNWQGTLAPNVAPGVTFVVAKPEKTPAAEPADPIVLHPLATLVGKQRVAPLDRPISRMGARRPAAGTRPYSLVVDVPAGVRVDSVSELFAPAQYSEVRDDAKLSGPAFVHMPAGAALSAQAAATHPAHGVATCDATLETLDVTQLDAEATPVGRFTPVVLAGASRRRRGDAGPRACGVGVTIE